MKSWQQLAHAWGQSRVLLATPNLEILRSQAFAGGASSLHRHRHKSHALIVVRGLVLIEFRTGRTTCLGADESATVAAGRWHRLVFPHDAQFLEVGYGSAVSLGDIERVDAGRPGSAARRPELRVHAGEED